MGVVFTVVFLFVEKKAPVKHDGQLFDSDDHLKLFSTSPCNPQVGTMMQAVSERQGRPVIVWSFRDSIWRRLIVAGKFDTNGCACTGKGLTPIVVVLRDKHFPHGNTLKSAPINHICWSGREEMRAVTSSTVSHDSGLG